MKLPNMLGHVAAVAELDAADVARMFSTFGVNTFDVIPPMAKLDEFLFANFALKRRR